MALMRDGGSGSRVSRRPSSRDCIPVSNQLLTERHPSFQRLHTHAFSYFEPSEHTVSTISRGSKAEKLLAAVSKAVSSRSSFFSAGIVPLLHDVLHLRDESSFITGRRYANGVLAAVDFYVYRSRSQNTLPMTLALVSVADGLDSRFTHTVCRTSLPSTFCSIRALQELGIMVFVVAKICQAVKSRLICRACA
jgi:hypothetical protein